MHGNAKKGSCQCTFGLLVADYTVVSKKRSFRFRFADDHPLVPALREVLGALDVAMPVWRITAEQQKGKPIPKRWDHRNRRRKSKRW
jgi:hypothetical protein